MSLEEARDARCAVNDCRRRMGGILGVQMGSAPAVELCACSEHGDAIAAGAPFHVQGVTIVLDPSRAAARDQPQAVWQRTDR
jgi:hypothetical protein